MRVKPDLRIRKHIGKQVRLIYKIDGICTISVKGRLTRGGYSKYMLVSTNPAGGEYCFFNARDVAASHSLSEKNPAFRMKNLKFAE